MKCAYAKNIKAERKERKVIINYPNKSIFFSYKKDSISWLSQHMQQKS
jgi:hypothetical protein